MKPVMNQWKAKWLTNMPPFIKQSMTHGIELILEDMAKPNLFPTSASMVIKERKITNFIYNNTLMLKLKRKNMLEEI